jgi:hypothetical protein
MRSKLVIYRYLGVLMALALVAGAAGAGVKVALSEVPAPAVKAVKDRFPKAEINFVDKEGKDLYEFAMKEGDRQFDVVVMADGKINAVKEEIEPKKVPDAVKDGVKKKFPGAEIVEAEKIVTGEGDKARTVFDLLIKTGKDKRSVTFDPTGKFIGDGE